MHINIIDLIERYLITNYLYYSLNSEIYEIVTSTEAVQTVNQFKLSNEEML